MNSLFSAVDDNLDPKLRNVLHSIVLVGGIAALTALCAWLLFGGAGVVWTFASVGLVLLLGPRVAPEAIMRMYHAQQVPPDHTGALMRIVNALGRRAGLEAQPKVYIIPSKMMNAFATGRRDDASIGVTTGLLNRLSTRELAGVIAHEMSHIRNGDLWIMGVADILSRLTLFMSYLAVFLVAVNLPLAMMGEAHIPWLPVLLLYFAPTISAVLQLALSRAREYDADLEGARLSGDPDGLASALMKLERYQGQFWENIFMPGRKNPAPSLLRSHPKTEDRVARLRELDPRDLDPLPLPTSPFEQLTDLGRFFGGPRYHWISGLWY
jgi:heat shock protein HtpX